MIVNNQWLFFVSIILNFFKGKVGPFFHEITSIASTANCNASFHPVFSCFFFTFCFLHIIFFLTAFIISSSVNIHFTAHYRHESIPIHLFFWRLLYSGSFRRSFNKIKLSSPNVFFWNGRINCSSIFISSIS